MSRLHQISYISAVGLRILNLAPGTAANVVANIDDEDFIRHIDLALVHIVRHLLGAFRPDFIVSAVTEEADADYYVAFKGEAFLRLKELLFKACAAAQGYYFVFADHTEIQ